jgi:competence protein CoiA
VDRFAHASAIHESYAPRAWERWCHAAYFGRVYYWETEQCFHAVHFGAAYTHVPEQRWTASGRERIAGGYDRALKRSKQPVHGQMVLLSEHFRPTMKAAWSSGSVVVPKCRLLLDTQEKWWP